MNAELLAEFLHTGASAHGGQPPDSPLDPTVQIDGLRRLKDGWLDGLGLAPSRAGLEWLASAFAANFPPDLPLPHFYPTPEGGVRAEWSLQRSELSLDIDLAARTGFWHALDLDDDTDDSENVNLGETAGWSWLTSELRGRAGAGA